MPQGICIVVQVQRPDRLAGLHNPNVRLYHAMVRMNIGALDSPFVLEDQQLMMDAVRWSDYISNADLQIDGILHVVVVINARPGEFSLQLACYSIAELLSSLKVYGLHSVNRQQTQTHEAHRVCLVDGGKAIALPSRAVGPHWQGLGRPSGARHRYSIHRAPLCSIWRLSGYSLWR